MLFNSLTFLVFFPITVAIYFALPHRFRWIHLLASSCILYAAFIPAYLLILFGVILIDFIAGIFIARSTGLTRRALLAASLVANVGILATFKYFNFVNANLRALGDLIHWNYPVRDLGWLLPIGLSFHTFQSMSYTIEVYRGRQPPERHLGIYALYVMFFPQLVAGPIERPQNLLHQFRERHDFDADRIYAGLRLMLWGFFKKLVIADRIAPIVNAVYANPQGYGGGWLILATWFFAIQIYCDFSGYSDVAIGAARVLGFGLMANFNRPYAATSVLEFWRRWHISLSSWFRDYVYIPLGGNRVGFPRWCANIMIVFVISGLWHGPSWTFIVWGAIHGVYLIVSRATTRWRAAALAALSITSNSAIHRIWQTACTFNLVAIGWIFFRADSMNHACWIVTHLLRRPFLMHPGANEFSFRISPFTVRSIQVAILAIIVLELVEWSSQKAIAKLWAAQPRWIRWPAYYALIISILAIGDLGSRSFIYFQF